LIVEPRGLTPERPDDSVRDQLVRNDTNESGSGSDGQHGSLGDTKLYLSASCAMVGSHHVIELTISHESSDWGHTWYGHSITNHTEYRMLSF
jgi:hypothetical protein